MKPTQIASIVALSIASSAALADQTTQLDTLVLSGGFTPISEESYARSYSIITEEQLEQSQEKTVSDVLRQVPGLHVSQSGGAGGLTAIRIRGSEDNHVLVLIDGIEAPDSSSAFDFSNLTADQIERIEVLKGPQSSLYGAGATAGVINIITKSAGKVGTSSSIAVEVASTGGETISAQMQQRSETGGLSVGITSSNQDGWDTSGETNGTKDGYEHKTINLKGDTTTVNGSDLNFVVRYTDRVNEYDATASGCGNSTCYVTDGNHKTTGHDLFAKVEADIDVYDGQAVFTPKLSYSVSSERDDGQWGVSTTESTTTGFAPQLSLYLGDDEEHNLVIAGEIQQLTHKGSATTSNTTKERNTSGIAVDYNSQLNNQLFVQAGIRYDYNDDFENATSWAASGSYQLTNESSLRASAGKGRTNPGFTELYGYGGHWTANPNLKPEENNAWDIGFDYTPEASASKLSFTYFNEELTNAIGSSGSQAVNLTGITKKKGYEISVGFNPTDNLNVGASYMYLDAKKSDGSSLARRPEHSSNVSISYAFMNNKALLDMDVTHSGSYDDKDWGASGAAVVVKAYTTTDVNGSYKLNKQTQLYASIKNLTNTQYQEVLGYNAQPRTIYAGIKHSW